MSYSDYGLDEVKKTKDDDVIAKEFWCMWCDDHHVSNGFSMCFSSIVICDKCANSSNDKANRKRWENTDYCFKCKKNPGKGYRSADGIATKMHLCEECMQWAKEVLNNKEKYFNDMVQDIFKRCVVEGNIVRLPEEQLDRKIYLEVQKKLELIGGKWKGGKTKGFVFEEDPVELLEAISNGDDRNLKKEFQFFATPKDIAKDMALLLQPMVTKDTKWLEPEAGDGALIKAVLEVFNSTYGPITIDCFETMELNRKKLGKVDGAKLIGYDFPHAVAIDEKNLIRRQYDIIIANPPFTNNQDILHIKAMYECLKPGGTIVTLCSQSWYNGTQRKQVAFKDWLESIGVFPVTLPAKSFQESGTNITPLRLMIQKPVEEKQEFDIETALGPFKITEDLPANIQPPMPERTCRVCGCTDDDCSQCIEKTGQPCYWVDDDLCSACANEIPVERKKEQVFSEEQIEAIGAGFSKAYKEMKQEEMQVSDTKSFDVHEDGHPHQHVVYTTPKECDATEVSDIDIPEPVTDVLENVTKEPESVQILHDIKQTNKEIDKGILELAQMLSPDQTKDMNFFSQLYELMDGIDVNIHFKRINGQLELKVVPETGAAVKPVSIKGSPADFDQDFFKVIQHPIECFKGLKLEMDEFHKSAVKAKEEAAMKVEDKKPEVKKPEVKKPAVNKYKVENSTKEEQKQKVAEPSLFD